MEAWLSRTFPRRAPATCSRRRCRRAPATRSSRPHSRRASLRTCASPSGQRRSARAQVPRRLRRHHTRGRPLRRRPCWLKATPPRCRPNPAATPPTHPSSQSCLLPGWRPPPPTLLRNPACSLDGAAGLPREKVPRRSKPWAASRGGERSFRMRSPGRSQSSRSRLRRPPPRLRRRKRPGARSPAEGAKPRSWHGTPTRSRYAPPPRRTPAESARHAQRGIAAGPVGHLTRARCLFQDYLHSSLVSSLSLDATPVSAASRSPAGDAALVPRSLIGGLVDF